jgi:dihydroorotate dehydrogenase (fumarate)
MGLALRHPFVAGASPLSADLDGVRRLEDGGASAIVLHSLFEEQITDAQAGRIHGLPDEDPQFAERLAAFPPSSAYPFSPEEYIEHLRRVKAAVAVPVIASLNGTNAGEWLRSASLLEEAGADGLEVNFYQVVTDFGTSASAVEGEILSAVANLKRLLRIPVSVKLSPFFTAFGNVAHSLDRAGADGLVLFNRFYQPDIDLATLTVQPRIALSTSAELLLRLRWIAALRGTVRASLALSGGVANAEDGIKGLLAGADVVQIVSGALRDGPGIFRVMRKGLVQWMKRREFTSIDDVRGRVRFERVPIDVSARARGAYLQTLQSWPKTD